MSSVVDSVGSKGTSTSVPKMCRMGATGRSGVSGLGSGRVGTMGGWVRYPVPGTSPCLLSLLSPSLTHPLLCSSMQSAGCRVLAI